MDAAPGPDWGQTTDSRRIGRIINAGLIRFIERRNMDRSSTSQFTKLLHQQTRLSTVAFLLRNGGEASFTDVTREIGVNPGLLSKHNGRLEEAGLIELRRTFVGRKTQTMLMVTALGRRAFAAHIAAMTAMAKMAAATMEASPPC
jgi:DNA-binding MarR family transcriptional regulator